MTRLFKTYLANNEPKGGKEKTTYLLRNIPQDLYMRARHEALERGVSFKELILTALEELLDKKEKNHEIK